MSNGKQTIRTNWDITLQLSVTQHCTFDFNRNHMLLSHLGREDVLRDNKPWKTGEEKLNVVKQ